MKTKEQALRDFQRVLEEEAAIFTKLTPEESARRVWHRGGPSVAELTERITALRAERSARVNLPAATLVPEEAVSS